MGIRNLVQDRFLLFAVLSLCTAVALWFFFDNSIQQQDNFVEDITENIHKELAIVNIDLQAVTEQIAENPSVPFDKMMVDSKYYYCVFSNGELAYWSDYRVPTKYESLKGDYDYKIIALKTGSYVARRILADTAQNIEVFSLLPISHNPRIKNKYLVSGFNEAIFYNSNISFTNQEQEHYNIFTEEGVFLFSVNFENGYKLQNHPVQLLVFFLVTSAIIFFILFLLQLVRRQVHHGKVLQGFLWLVFGLAAVRFLMLAFSFPFGIIDFDLFNARFFASSNLNPSLGDLLLNALSVFAVAYYLFRYYYRFKIYRYILNTEGMGRQLLSFALILSSYFLLLMFYELMMNMQKHAQWILDITISIDFSFFKLISLLVFTIGSLSYFMAVHIIFKTAIRLNKNNTKKMLLQFALATAVFVSLSLFIKWPFILLACITGTFFLVVYFLQLTNHFIRVSYFTFIYFFVAAMVTSTVGAYTIYKFDLIRNIADQENLATQILSDRDILGEYLLNETIAKTKADEFIAFTFTNLFSSKSSVKQKIKRKHLNGYLDKYDITINLFDQKGNPIENPGYVDNYFQLKNNYENEEEKTEYNAIFHYEKTENEGGYIAFIPIKYSKSDKNSGFITLNLSLKRIIPNSVYPELLVDQEFAISKTKEEYSYGLYVDKALQNTFGIFNVSNDFSKADLANDKLYDRGFRKGNNYYLGVKGEKNKVVVMSSKAYQGKDFMANFSFLFLLLVFSVLIVLIIYSIRFGVKGTDINLTTKIQMYLNFAFFLPLIIVSISTLSLLSSNYKDQREFRYFKKAEGLKEGVTNLLERFHQNRIDQEELTENLKDIAKYAESDLNLFSNTGKLIASTQPLIYEYELLSGYLHPTAMSAFINGENRFILDESVGKLQYNTTFYGLKSSETARLTGILTIPFFDSENELDKQIITVLGNILIIFTIIFIAFLVFSYFASRFLTTPLQYITEKIRRITLTDTNTPMVWNANDEIGLLVGEYNKMLLNLEASKEALAQSEKESAWREMAQQVAHEIKNPLTPMKLNLQHLKRVLGDDDEQAQKTQKMIGNLLHQIDTLSDIATSFSSFAQMPTPKNERFELSAMLKKSIDLHKSDKNITIHAQIEAGKFYVLGDEKMFGRIINNLIINGVQSVEDGRAMIEISLEASGKKVIIEVKDNGSGIEDNIAGKIFIPKFSTKETGSGIGLAIAKRGVEHAGGSIWFETKIGLGTAFFIELPLID